MTVNGQAVAGYTVQAVGLNGEVYAHETPATNSVVLSNLVPGWTYNILVSANGGAPDDPHALIGTLACLLKTREDRFQLGEERVRQLVEGRRIVGVAEKATQPT